MTTSEQLLLARNAIAHALGRIADDPRAYWLLGYGTETYTLLTAAHAELQGLPIADVRTAYRPDSKRRAQYIQQREDEQRWIELGKAREAQLRGVS